MIQSSKFSCLVSVVSEIQNHNKEMCQILCESLTPRRILTCRVLMDAFVVCTISSLSIFLENIFRITSAQSIFWRPNRRLLGDASSCVILRARTSDANSRSIALTVISWKKIHENSNHIPGLEIVASATVNSSFCTLWILIRFLIYKLRQCICNNLNCIDSQISIR